MSNRRNAFRALVVLGKSAAMAALPGPVSAQPPDGVAVTPRESGTVDIADLQLLLGQDIHFQHFDFQTAAPFCLNLSYAFSRQRVDADEQHVGQVCHRDGEHRLLVAMRFGSGQWRLTFGLHERSSGSGASLSSDSPLNGIASGEIVGWSEQIPREILMAQRDASLLKWSTHVQTATGDISYELDVRVSILPNEGGQISATRYPDSAE